MLMINAMTNNAPNTVRARRSEVLRVENMPDTRTVTEIPLPVPVGDGRSFPHDTWE